MEHIQCFEYEIFQPTVNITDVEMVESLNTEVLSNTYSSATLININEILTRTDLTGYFANSDANDTL